MYDFFDFVINSTTVHELATRVGYVTMTVSVFNILGVVAFALQLILREQRRDIFAVLYLALMCSDIITSTSGVNMGYRLSRLQVQDINKTPHGVVTFEKFTSALLFGVSVRFSTLVTGVLGVVRCISLWYPLYVIRVNIAYIFLTTWLAATTLAISLPFAARSYTCPLLPFPCTHIWFGGRTWNSVLSVGVPFILPLITSTVSLLAILSYRIRIRMMNYGNYRQPSSNTVLWFTFVVIFCTTISSGIQLTNSTSTNEVKTAIQTLALLLRCFLNTLVFIGHNSIRTVFSTVNQRTLLANLGRTVVLRGSEIQQHVVSNPAVQQTARSVRWDRRAQRRACAPRLDAISETGASEVGITETMFPVAGPDIQIELRL